LSKTLRKNVIARFNGYLIPIWAEVKVSGIKKTIKSNEFEIFIAERSVKNDNKSKK